MWWGKRVRYGARLVEFFHVFLLFFETPGKFSRGSWMEKGCQPVHGRRVELQEKNGRTCWTYFYAIIVPTGRVVQFGLRSIKVLLCIKSCQSCVCATSWNVAQLPWKSRAFGMWNLKPMWIRIFLHHGCNHEKIKHYSCALYKILNAQSENRAIQLIQLSQDLEYQVLRVAGCEMMYCLNPARLDLKSVEDHVPCNVEWRRFRRAHSGIAADVPARYMDPLGSESPNVGETKVAWCPWSLADRGGIALNGFDVKRWNRKLCLWQLIRQVLFCACCGAFKTAVAKGPDALQALRPW